MNPGIGPTSVNPAPISNIFGFKFNFMMPTLNVFPKMLHNSTQISHCVIKLVQLDLYQFSIIDFNLLRMKIWIRLTQVLQSNCLVSWV